MSEDQRIELLNAISLLSALKYEGDDFKLSKECRVKFRQQAYDSLLKILDEEDK